MFLSPLAIAIAAVGSAQTAKPPMLGVWQGEAAVVVPWLRQRKLPVTLTISANDSVSGTIGDATLVSGWLMMRDPGSRTGLRWNTDYIILGNLVGPIVRAEGVWRPAVQIPLTWNGSTFVGGLATSGWMAGGVDHRAVEANLVLRRVIVAMASRSANSRR
jgi:hypothetical protein